MYLSDVSSESKNAILGVYSIGLVGRRFGVLGLRESNAFVGSVVHSIKSFATSNI